MPTAHLHQPDRDPSLDDTPPQLSGVRVRQPSRLDALVPTADETPSAYGDFLRHAYVTGVSTLPLIMAIATGVGSAMVLQTTMAPMPPSSELGRMLVVVVMRELAPLMTAVIIAGLWGRALSLDLRSEVQRSVRLGPRILGTMVASVALGVYFAIAAMLGAYIMSQALTVRTFDAVREGFHMELAWFDLPLFMLKTGGLGAIVAWLGGREIAQVSTPADVAEASSRVFVRALLVGGMFSIGLTLALYTLTGAPAPP